MKSLQLTLIRGLCTMLAVGPFPAFADDLGESLNRRYDQNTYLTAHNAFASTHEHFDYFVANQTDGLKAQLDGGVRCLALDIYILRQKVKDHLYYEFERYTNRNDYVTPSSEFEGTDPEIVVAHEPDTWGYGLFADAGFILRPFQNLYAELLEIKEWMDDHPNEVVTITFESYVYEPDGLWSFFQAAGLDSMVFFADRPNPGIYGPDGTIWNVPVHGWPRLREMVNAGKRLVVFSDNGVEWTRYSGQPIGGAKTTDDDGMPFYWNLAVESKYGDDVIDNGVGDARRASDPLDNMLIPLTAMNWFPDANLQGPDAGGGNDPAHHLWNYGNLNSYKVLSSARDIFAAAAKRYPNFISVDYYHKGGDGGPRRVVKECNTYWANRPVVTATITVTPTPNVFGWRRSVQVLARADVSTASSSVRWLNYYWHGGNDILGHNEETKSIQAYPVVIPLNNGRGTNDPILGRTNDGVFRVSAEGVTALGDRSDRAVTWVRIDATPPTVQPIAIRPPDGPDGWYRRPVTLHVIISDLLSGPRNVWWTNALGQTNYSEVYISDVTNQMIQRTFEFVYMQEGAAFIHFNAEDYAGNVNPTNSGFIQIKLDLTPPSTVVSGYARNASTTTVSLRATDTLSGTNGTWYQADAETNWTIYTGQITLSSTQAHTLRFYSRDVAGNDEPVQTFRISQTALSVSAARNPAGYFQALEVTATITGAGPRPTGTVTFLDGTNVMGTATLDTNGVARITLTPLNYTLARGAHQITARYEGNGSYASATSAPLSQEVVDPPGVSLTVSTLHAVQTQPITLSAEVVSGDERIPNGTITFHVLVAASGREKSGVTVPLDTNGQATLLIDDLPVGYYYCFADYSGDEAFPSNSSPGARELFIDQAYINMDVTTSPNPSHVGEPVTFTIATSVTPGAMDPGNGSIHIEESDEPVADVPVAGASVVTYRTSGLSEGDHTFLITANLSSHLSGARLFQHQVLPQVAQPPIFRDILTNDSGNVELRLDVLFGRGVQLEYSDHLTNWADLAVGTNTGAYLRMTDNSATNRPMRFYRARLLE